MWPDTCCAPYEGQGLLSTAVNGTVEMYSNYGGYGDNNAITSGVGGLKLKSHPAGL
jgi:hypothetical protein